MNNQTDFATELERIDKDIAELVASALLVAADSGKATKYVYRLYQRASLMGNLAEFAAVETALNEAIRLSGPGVDFYYLKAHLDFKLHRQANASRDLEMAPGLRASVKGRALQADLDFQAGRYTEARKGYEAVIQADRTWDNLVRLAYFKAKMGDIAAAERLYMEAEDEITAKQMRAYAWVELQRGLLALSQGDHATTLAHYRRADQAYSGYWLVDEHMAELLAVQGKFDEAIARYQKVIAYVPKPELQQALGELYAFMGKPEQAQPWYEKALHAYLKSAQQGDVHYYHHLVDFYADVRKDGVEAVKWARKDIELRQNFSTQAALAWAFYRDAQLAQAIATMQQALASGVMDAHLFAQAAEIYLSAGETEQANQYLQRAAAINPNYQNFHIHR